MPMGLPCGRRVPKGNLRWYLLRVPEGREQSVCDLLKRIIPGELLEDAFAPRKERWAKRGGAWGLETVRMYRGYAFAATRDVSGLANALARTTAAAELVGEFGRSWMPLAPEAQDWLEASMDGEHVKEQRRRDPRRRPARADGPARRPGSAREQGRPS